MRLIFNILAFILSVISADADGFSWIRGGWNSFGLGSWVGVYSDWLRNSMFLYFKANQRSQYINPIAEPEPSFGRRFFNAGYRVPSPEPEPSFYFPQPEPFSSIPLAEPEPEPEPVIRRFGSGFVKQSLVASPNIIETPKPSPKIIPFSAPSNSKPFFQENPEPLPPAPQQLEEPLLEIQPDFRSFEENIFSEARVQFELNKKKIPNYFQKISF